MKHIGTQTVKLQYPPSIVAEAAIVGQKEGEGPLKDSFDQIEGDAFFGQDSFEKAESTLVENTFNKAIEKSGLQKSDIQYAIAGDLLDQCIGANFAMRSIGLPFFGLFGACSTMAESLSVGSMLIDGDFASHVLVGTSSHFCSAERQFRFPLDYGGQRPPSAQWTVTGSGALILGKHKAAPYVTHITTGKVVDMGIKDANSMGGAMAPAFADTLKAHFTDTGRQPSYYDLILSGDLGEIGKAIAIQLCADENLDISPNYNDCGCMIFDNQAQDTHAGGSGCGCSASVLCGHIMALLRSKMLNRVLFVATGALLSPTSTMQGESIPAIAHAVAIENELS